MIFSTLLEGAWNRNAKEMRIRDIFNGGRHGPSREKDKDKERVFLPSFLILKNIGRVGVDPQGHCHYS